jgi:hypothetical protein
MLVFIVGSSVVVKKRLDFLEAVAFLEEAKKVVGGFVPFAMGVLAKELAS